ncbi:MAG: DUF4290 domain-containing protein [Bacteroidales bacterium]|nr:DUF4290 domain-containing protein [Bacteroidales bacterium]MCF6341680.1 DUF4290 domain-containing protein [Bacteroidales bacterium]
MEYNSQREKMIIPEYGRNVQKMIEYAKTIEDKEKRTKSAEVIVRVMAGMNPQIKESSDYLHTLWDHLYFISNFDLDVDSPFPMPAKEILFRKPDKVEYSNKNFKVKHYGKYIEKIIARTIELEEGPEKEALILIIANHLKKSYLNWNRDSVNDETILKHLEELSNGKLSITDTQFLSSTGDILARNKIKKKKFVQRNKDNKRKGKKSY